MSSYIAIIPARKGSKRLPRKNKMGLAGKPLVVWTIGAAVDSNRFEEVVVSTDDSDVAEIAKRHGAQVPFLRPTEFSGDTASSFSAAKHCLDYYKDHHNKTFEFTVLLQPTSPMRDAVDIENAILYCEQKEADAVISVCREQHAPFLTKQLPADLSMNNFLPNVTPQSKSDTAGAFYRVNGAIYIVRTAKLLEQETFYLDENTFAFVMDREKSVDIDSMIDFKLAEFLISSKN